VNQNFSGGLLNAGLLVLLFWGLSSATPFIVPLLVAALLAFLMAPLVRVMRRFRVPEALTLTCSALLLVLPFFGLIFLLIHQGQALIRDFPALVGSIDRSLAAFSHSWVGQKLGSDHALDLTGVLKRLSAGAERGVAFAIGGLATVLDATSKVALVLVFAIVMLASRENLLRSAERLLADAGNQDPRALLREVTQLVERFLFARLLIMLLVGLFDLIVLELFHVHYAILLAAFIGFMTMVPAIGLILSLVPTLVVAVSSGFSFLKLFALFLVLFAVGMVESNVLTPKMVGKRLNINALGTFVGLYAGGVLWGVPGMLLSVPILGVLRIALCASPRFNAWAELLSEDVAPPVRPGLRRVDPGTRDSASGRQKARKPAG
jgi:predicted PurR-regulated permease PerM